MGGKESRSPYLLPSLLFVTDTSVYFGSRAEAASRRGERSGRLPFTSPKQYLSTHALDALDERLPPDIDPTGQYSAKQLITLYLAYLLRRAEEAAKAPPPPESPIKGWIAANWMWVGGVGILVVLLRPDLATAVVRLVL